LNVAGWSYPSSTTNSRFILAWRLQPDMTAASLIEVVQDTVGKMGTTEAPLPATVAWEEKEDPIDLRSG
jgi:hypothetical protein